ncbi:hypothetical protein NI420_002333 [Salmonella enterica]|nr:hypothetical protein [Salmonella enterica]EJJ4247338.1 hypothetical protein [Salmonella enterica]
MKRIAICVLLLLMAAISIRLSFFSRNDNATDESSARAPVKVALARDHSVTTARQDELRRIEKMR